MEPQFKKTASGTVLGPIRRPAERAPDALQAYRDLVRELDSWCRERGKPAVFNAAVAQAAVDRVWARPGGREPVRLDVVSAGQEHLPGELRRWPARWRYLVADLERGGMEREAAVEVVRWGAEAIGSETQARQPAA